MSMTFLTFYSNVIIFMNETMESFQHIILHEWSKPPLLCLMPDNHSQNIHYIQSQPQKIQKDIKKREKECIHIRSMMHTDQGRWNQ